MMQNRLHILTVLALMIGFLASPTAFAAKKGKCPAGYSIYVAAPEKMGCRRTSYVNIREYATRNNGGKWTGCRSSGIFFYREGFEVDFGPNKGEDICYSDVAGAAKTLPCVGPMTISEDNCAGCAFIEKEIVVGGEDRCYKKVRKQTTNYKDVILYD
jgi:hypothetical protein